jgi:hypothetical protein
MKRAITMVLLAAGLAALTPAASQAARTHHRTTRRGHVRYVRAREGSPAEEARESAGQERRERRLRRHRRSYHEGTPAEEARESASSERRERRAR